MRRRRVVCVAVIILLLLGLGVWMVLLMAAMPDDWAAFDYLTSPEIERLADAASEKMDAVYEQMEQGEGFEGRFTDAEVNAYLREEGLADDLPAAISGVRVRFHDGYVTAMFLLGRGSIKLVARIEFSVLLHDGGRMSLNVRDAELGNLPFPRSMVRAFLGRMTRNSALKDIFTGEKIDPDDLIIVPIQIEQLSIRRGEVLFRGCVK